MDDIETFLKNPEAYLAISSPDQLLIEYPSQFTQNKIDENIQVLVELSGKNKNLKERVFCSSKYITLIESDDNYNIWDLDMTDTKVLNSINTKVVGLGIRNEKGTKRVTEEIVIPDYQKLVRVTFLPNTVESSNCLIAMLNKRKELLHKEE